MRWYLWTPVQVFIALSLTGWVFLIWGLLARHRRRVNDRRENVRADGVIVDYSAREEDAGGKEKAPTLYPVVEFQVGHYTYRQKCEGRSDPEKYPIGCSVEVFYDPEDPTRLHLKGSGKRTGSGQFFRIAVVWIICSGVATEGLSWLSPGPWINFRHIMYRLSRPISTVSPNVPDYNVDGDYQYSLANGITAVITEYHGDDERLTLPLLLGGHPVTEVSQMVFMHDDHLKAVVVPGNIASVPAGCFSGCLKLSEVEIQEGVERIEQQAFVFCVLLSEVRLPASVISIADSAFPENCAARFHVPADSEAERYCKAKGFEYQVDGRSDDSVP